MLQSVWELTQQLGEQLSQTVVTHLDSQSPLSITTGQIGIRKYLRNIRIGSEKYLYDCYPSVKLFLTNRVYLKKLHP
jgi:hypothetical protein